MIWLLPSLNLLGGRGLFPGGRFLFRMVLMPATVVLYLNTSWILSIAIFICFALWAFPGHGKYWAAFHGKYFPEETEIKWIDYIGEKIYPFDNKKETNLKRGILCMTIRELFIFPLFIILTYINKFSILIGFGMLLGGWCAGICRYVSETNARKFNEYIIASLILILITIINLTK